MRRRRAVSLFGAQNFFKSNTDEGTANPCFTQAPSPPGSEARREGRPRPHPSTLADPAESSQPPQEFELGIAVERIAQLDVEPKSALHDGLHVTEGLEPIPAAVPAHATCPAPPNGNSGAARKTIASFRMPPQVPLEPLHMARVDDSPVVRRNAGLSGVDELRPDDARRRDRQVGVRSHDARVLAATRAVASGRLRRPRAEIRRRSG